MVESVADGVRVYDDPAGVLTNNPPFPMQLFALNNYAQLSPEPPVNRFAPDLPLETYSRGMGAMGLPEICPPSPGSCGRPLCGPIPCPATVRRRA